METSDVRRRVIDTIDRARRQAAEHRVRNDEASRAYGEFLEHTAIPLFRQVAGALKASGYPFAVFTPGGAVRLVPERSAEDYIEISLDTSGPDPAVVLHVRRGRGRRIIETERPLPQAVAEMTDSELLESVLTELQPFVER